MQKSTKIEVSGKEKKKIRKGPIRKSLHTKKKNKGDKNKKD